MNAQLLLEIQLVAYNCKTGTIVNISKLTTNLTFLFGSVLFLTSCRAETPPAGSTVEKSIIDRVEISVETPTLDVIFVEARINDAITLPNDRNPNDINLPSGTIPMRICLAQGEEEACAMAIPNEPLSLFAIFNGEKNEFAVNYPGPLATFDEAYRAAYKGKVRVEVPEVYELVNIAITLSDYAKENPDAIAPSPYADEVRAHFSPWGEHPFIQAVNALFESDGGMYAILKMKGAAFDFTAGATIKRSDIYKNIGWGQNVLIPLQSQMSDFAERSGFRTFYDEHRPLYRAQINEIQTDINLREMWDWLQGQFPDVQAYDTVRVLFSPLVGYNQSLATFDSNGFRELQPHVNFPRLVASRNRSDAADEAVRGVPLFTELNHGFINPVTDAMTDEIYTAMGADLTPYVRANSAATSYNGHTAVYTEMLNWALVSVYAQSKLDEATALEVSQNISDSMVNGRGFKRFEAFQDALLQITGSPEGPSISEAIERLATTDAKKWTVE